MMFPRFTVSVSGLNAEQKYAFFLEMVLVDNFRYNYVNSQWIPVGEADEQVKEKMIFCHPDNAKPGKFWMKGKVSFKEVKLTTNKANKHNHVSVSHNMSIVVVFLWQ